MQLFERDRRVSWRADPAQPAPEPEKFEDPSGSPWPRGHRFADRSRANHATVHELLAAGFSHRAIGRQLRMTSRTVKLCGRKSCRSAINRIIMWNLICSGSWASVVSRVTGPPA